MIIGGLFEGIGGFPLAATWAGIKPVWSNDIDPYCCDVLRKNFQHEIIQADIRDIGKGRRHELTPVDIISGGFPCQPFSSAGKRKGKADDRYLWPEMLRVIREVKPAWVVGENVAGILSMDGGAVFEQICTSLEDEGYTVEAFVIPACAAGAPHRRDRIWIVAHAKSSKRKQSCSTRTRRNGSTNSNTPAPNATSRKAQPTEQGGFHAESCSPTEWGEHWMEVATRLCGMDDGLPSSMDSNDKKTIYNAVRYFGREKTEQRTGLDLREVENRIQRTARLKAIGNAIVPQVAYQILKAIKNHD